MKKNLLFLGFVFVASNIFAQCSELFISEYVEGYANNKALEIYNPTSAAIDLSQYSIARFSNGATSTGDNRIIQLPSVMLASNEVFVIVVDLTDTTLWDSQFDKPAWNGYNLIDTLFDQVTGDPILDSLGNVILGPQYIDGNAIFGNVYDEKYDLQCKADVFLCPDYDTNNSMYFNGNDAMALVKGLEVAQDGSNLVDVIGVIGENPVNTIMEDAWVDENGYWLTKDRSLVRKPDVAGGRFNLSDVVYAAGGTFTGTEWDSYPKNSFQFLGIHNSVCNNSSKPDEFSCVTGVATYEVNTIPFNMFPNPNTTKLLVIEAAEQIDRVEVYNLLGQRVFTEKVGFSSDKIELNLGNFENGMYLVNLIFDDNQVSIQKLVVE
jgi:Secretion system C-terminal sorting domain/Lamin Tail Domain